MFWYGKLQSGNGEKLRDKETDKFNIAEMLKIKFSFCSRFWEN